MVRLGRVGPAPRICERVKLRLAYFAARLTKQDVIISVRIKRRIEINKIDTGIRELVPVAQPSEIIAEIKPVHLSEVCERFRFRSTNDSLVEPGAWHKRLYIL